MARRRGGCPLYPYGWSTASRRLPAASSGAWVSSREVESARFSRCTVAELRRTQMKPIRQLWILGTVALVTLSLASCAPTAPSQPSAQVRGPASYADVTDSRLLNPEPQNWLMYRGNYSGWGYSPLDRITPSNVKKLVPVWSF